MTFQYTNSKLTKEDFLKKAEALCGVEAEIIIFSSPSGSYIRRIESRHMTTLQALAMQLEESQLAAWRAKIAEIRSRGKD